MYLGWIKGIRILSKKGIFGDLLLNVLSLTCHFKKRASLMLNPLQKSLNHENGWLLLPASIIFWKKGSLIFYIFQYLWSYTILYLLRMENLFSWSINTDTLLMICIFWWLLFVYCKINKTFSFERPKFCLWGISQEKM